eukprot:ANDGO_07703.mRNA.1 CLIP-associated protein
MKPARETNYINFLELNFPAPIKVSSDRDLAREIEKIDPVLRDFDAPWDARQSALTRIAGIAVGGAPNLESWIPTLTSLVRNCLSKQVTDLRSSVVKEACATIVILARLMKTEFEPFAAELLPPLMKLVIVTVAIMADSGLSCVRALIECCCSVQMNAGSKIVTHRFLSKITEGLASRHGILRQRCAEFMLLTLQVSAPVPRLMDASPLNDVAIEIVEKYIKLCVGDAATEVRTMGRSSWRAYNLHFPDRARRLFSSFDSSTQKLINEEPDRLGNTRRGSHSSLSSSSNSLSGLADNGNNHNSLGSSTGSYSSLSTDDQKPLSQTWPRPPSLNLGSISPPSTTQEQNRMPLNLGAPATPTQRPRPSTSLSSSLGAPVAPLHSNSSSHLLGPPQQPGSSSSLATPTGSFSAVPSRLSGSASAAQSPVHAQSATGSSTVRRELSTTTPALSASLQRPSSAMGFPSGKGAMASSTPDRHANAGSSVLLGGSGSRPARQLHMEHRDSAMRNVEFEEQQQQRPASAMPAERRDSFSGNGGNGAGNGYGNGNGNGYSSSKPVSTAAASASMDRAIALTSSSDWSKRIEGFQMINDSVSSDVIAAHIEAVLQVFLDHISDPHFRVAQTCLLHLSSLLMKHTRSLELQLERILPKLFIKLGDSKDVVKSAASLVLEKIGDLYPPETLVVVVLRLLGNKEKVAKVQLAALEFLIHVLPNSHDLLSLSNPNGSNSIEDDLTQLPTVTRSLFARLVAETRDRAVEVRKAAAACVVVLSRVVPRELTAYLTGTLTLTEQQALQKVVTVVAPNIVLLESVVLSSGPNSPGASPSRRVDNDHPYERDSSMHSAALAPAPASSHPASSKQHATVSTASPARPMSATNGHHSTQPSVPAPGPAQPVVNKNVQRTSVPHEQQTKRPSSAMATTKPASAPPPVDAAIQKEATSGSSTKVGVSKPAPIRPSSSRASGSGPSTSASAAPGSAPSGSQAQTQPQQSQSQSQSAPSTLPSASEPAIPTLLGILSAGTDMERQNSLAKLLSLCRDPASQSAGSAFTQAFGQVLLSAMERMVDTSSPIRESALLLFKEMVARHTALFSAFTEVVLTRLLETSVGSNASDGQPMSGVVRLVPQISEDALDTFAGRADTLKAFRCLSSVISSQQQATLQIAIKTLSKVLGRMAHDSLLPLVSLVLPGLFEAFKNPNADVRKSVVFCLVDMYMVLGDDFTPYLSELNTSQLKLVTIYINRMARSAPGPSTS